MFSHSFSALTWPSETSIICIHSILLVAAHVSTCYIGPMSILPVCCPLLSSDLCTLLSYASMHVSCISSCGLSHDRHQSFHDDRASDIIAACAAGDPDVLFYKPDVRCRCWHDDCRYFYCRISYQSVRLLSTWVCLFRLVAGLDACTHKFWAVWCSC